ncbi:MAG: penicillin-binding protein 1C [Synergistaceae bacterium]|jgi:penicillin-binding protein 1C|nr:penicillin-binding protein 1C [Synergistaceae bacterium]
MATRKKIMILAGSAALVLIPLFVFIARNDFPIENVFSYDASRVIYDTNGNVLNVRLSDSDEWCVPISLDKMGRWTSKAAVSIEDKRFYDHCGVDFLAILRSAYYNLRSRRIVSGASTITSQLIRISYPRERTYRAKVIEFISAVKLEFYASKEEILEIYLNRAPFGGNIRGVEAASRIYFDKSAKDLSLAESTLLISLLKSPSRLRPDRFPDRAREARDEKLLFLAERNIITDENMRISMRERVSTKRYRMPRNASMASMHIEKASGEERSIRSTIDVSLQLMLEKKLQEAIRLFPQKITAAGIILDNKTGGVLAYVGNSRHGTPIEGSQVDCGNAPRSPGSTLKPFVYAIAFESGKLTPNSLLADTPISFAGDAPRNFDLVYRGPVSARNALASSLNAPAARVLRMVGYGRALSRLNLIGFRHISKESSHYADSLILGGCEVTLVELSNAYRALSNSGTHSTIVWRKGDGVMTREAFTPEASFLTTDILRDERRLIPLYQDIFGEQNRKIAFKTGTSYALRDAWSIGYSEKYTVGVWIGSPSGKSDSLLVGLKTAAPAMLEIFKAAEPVANVSNEIPDGIYKRDVCALSGAVPSRYCPHVVKGYYIRDVTNVEVCKMHKKNGSEVEVVWPHELNAWVQTHKYERSSFSGVKIIQPVRSSKFILQNKNQKERIMLKAEGARRYHWYLDGKYVGSDKGDGLFADVGAGSHRLNVLAEEKNDSISFRVITASEIRAELADHFGKILE